VENTSCNASFTLTLLDEHEGGQHVLTPNVCLVTNQILSKNKSRDQSGLAINSGPFQCWNHCQNDRNLEIYLAKVFGGAD